MADPIPANIPGIPGTMKTILDQAIGPDDIGRYGEKPIVWEDGSDIETPEEATSLDPEDNRPAAEAGEPVEAVPVEAEHAPSRENEDEADLVSVESEAPEAMAADEVYAASFQSEDDDQAEA